MKKPPVPAVIVAEGICRKPGAPDFFSPLPEDVQKAKNICALCPVRFACLQYAVSGEPETYGVWGGADQWELRIACAMTPHGEPVKRARIAKCPFCRSTKYVTEVRELTGRGSQAHCTRCGLTWRRARSFVKKKRASRAATAFCSDLEEAA